MVILVILDEGINCWTRGFYTNKKKSLYDSRINTYSDNIIMLSPKGCLSKTFWTLLSKWSYDDNGGRILRWSKYHKEIEAKYRQLTILK